ncbi:hypothetical protein [Undibacterium sp. TC4M20W]|uniref:hypothetical protein n=1 Tax=Undibacterium sp. TC4M20W TaxID=3413052 RepID=UPI003BF49270
MSGYIYRRCLAIDMRPGTTRAGIAAGLSAFLSTCFVVLFSVDFYLYQENPELHKPKLRFTPISQKAGLA